MPIEAVIFDLDGTLANFNLDFKGLRGEIREYLLHHGVPSSLIDVNESIFEMLKKAEIFFRNNTKSAKAFEDVRFHALKIAEKYEMEAASTTSLIAGVVETLRDLLKMNLVIGLCTSSSEKAVNYILHRFKINDFFRVVISRDRVNNIKPHTEQCELALKMLGLQAKETLIVGDSVVDMESTRKLNSIAVGFPTGLYTAQQLINNGANYIVTSLTDLPALIKEINKD